MSDAEAKYSAEFVSKTLARHSVDELPAVPLSPQPAQPTFVRHGNDWYLNLACCEPDLDDL
jgi:hypothetical protein